MVVKRKCAQRGRAFFTAPLERSTAQSQSRPTSGCLEHLLLKKVICLLDLIGLCGPGFPMSIIVAVRCIMFSASHINRRTVSVTVRARCTRRMRPPHLWSSQQLSRTLQSQQGKRFAGAVASSDISLSINHSDAITLASRSLLQLCSPLSSDQVLHT